ncbi:MAG: glycosyltransferase family 2 protein [Eubacteriales bacterium]|nr:glycosyltransferase family 2 protein [Eubacteriales bacterium]
MSEVAVLIPCYNEEQTVAQVIYDYRAALPEASIYVYDNNSSDRTAEIVRELGQNDAKIYIRHEYRQGKGNVIKSMLRDIDADCYLLTDGDDTYPAESAPEMVQLVLEGKADMVVGDRLSSTYFTENKRPFHNSGNVLVRKLINSLFKSNVRDIMTGYRALSREFAKCLPIMSKGFEIETEMTIHAVDKNFLIRQVKVDYRDRPEGSESKLNTFSDGAKVLRTIFMLFKNYKPLVFFGTVAVALMVLAIALFIPVLMDFSRTGLVAKFPTLIVCGIIGLSSLLSFSVGIILDVEIQKHKLLYEMLLNNFHLNENRVSRPKS